MVDLIRLGWQALSALFAASGAVTLVAAAKTGSASTAAFGMFLGGVAWKCWPKALPKPENDGEAEDAEAAPVVRLEDVLRSMSLLLRRAQRGYYRVDALERAVLAEQEHLWAKLRSAVSGDDTEALTALSRAYGLGMGEKALRKTFGQDAVVPGATDLLETMRSTYGWKPPLEDGEVDADGSWADAMAHYRAALIRQILDLARGRLMLDLRNVHPWSFSDSDVAPGTHLAD